MTLFDPLIRCFVSDPKVWIYHLTSYMDNPWSYLSGFVKLGIFHRCAITLLFYKMFKSLWKWNIENTNFWTFQKKGIFEIRVTVASFLGSKTVAKAYYDHHPTSLHICSHEKYKQSSYTKWLFCGGFLELGRSFWNLRFLKDFCRFL